MNQILTNLEQPGWSGAASPRARARAVGLPDDEGSKLVDLAHGEVEAIEEGCWGDWTEGSVPAARRAEELVYSLKEQA